MTESKKRLPNFFQDNLQDVIVNYRANLISQLSVSPINLSESLNSLESQAILLQLRPLGREETDLNFSITTILESNDRVAIIGAPGSGKTTLLKLIALLASRGILRNVSNIPVILQPNSSDKSIEQETKKQIENISKSKISEENIESLLSQGKLLLLIDGLDETIKSDQYQFKILDLVNKYPKSNIIVSSRPITNLNKLNFPTYQIAPLSENEIKQLVDLWSIDAPSTANQFLAALRSSLGLISLASNPLLLKLMYETFKKKGSIPFDKNLLQEEDIYSLLSSSSIGTKQSEEFAEKIAIYLHNNKQTIITEEELRNQIFNYSDTFTQDDIDTQLTILIKSNILEKRSQGQYNFSHLLLQEHFCANSLKKLPKDKLIELLTQNVGDTWWESVFSILAQNLPFTNDVVYALLQKEDPNSRLLAAKLTIKSKNTYGNLRKIITSNLCELLYEDTYEIALKASDLLIQINEPEVEKNCFDIVEKYYSEKPLTSISAIYILATKGKESSSFYNLLSSYIHNSDSKVRYQTCKTLGAINTKQSAELLISALKGEKNEDVLEQTISSLYRTNASRKVSSAKLAELYIELSRLKNIPSEEIKTWVEQLERGLANQKTSTEA